MKPILFAANATTFTSNGLGALDPTSCVVTEERNGQYELECVVPVDSDHFSDLHNNMILVVIPGDGMSVHPTSQRQAFRIYHITEPLNGLVTINARHISYDLSYNTVMPFTATGIQTAFSGIVANMVETNLFSFNTDKTTGANFKVSVPQTARQLLGGQQGSILDVYGGEYQWDNWTVDLWGQRGTDSDVTLRYGKNITDISQEENLENVVTGIVPFWAGEDQTVTLPEKSVDSAYASQYPYKRTVPVDFSSDWEETPTESQLRNRAQTYITANKIGVPKVSIKVSFVALWQTEEYKSVAPLERVHLCDTVGVVFEKYGINTRAEVIKTEWDCLSERYLSIELGEAHSSFARTLVDMNDQTNVAVQNTKTDLQNAIERATAALTGVNGGHIRWVLDSNNEPQEMLIMDTDDESTARVIWRYNVAGWGVSTDGGQTYTMAAVLDTTPGGNGCAFSANYVTAGTMSAARIRGGVLQSSDSELDPNFLLDLVSGALAAKRFSIVSPNFTLTESGKLTSKNSQISPSPYVEVDQGAIKIGTMGSTEVMNIDTVFGVRESYSDGSIGTQLQATGVWASLYLRSLYQNVSQYIEIEVRSDNGRCRITGSGVSYSSDSDLHIDNQTASGNGDIYIESKKNIYLWSGYGDIFVRGSNGYETTQSGTFEDANGRTITVTNGLITGGLI